MATLTIRDISESVMRRLRVRADARGTSIEVEAATIIEKALFQDENLGEAIHRRFAELGGVDLELPERMSARKPPDFSE